MRIIKVIGFAVLLAITGYIVVDAKDDDKETPPWMEDIKVRGRSTYLVPKGAKREIIGSQVVVEPPNEYVARRIYEIELYLEKEFKEIEISQNELKDQLDELKKACEAMKDQMSKNTTIPEEAAEENISEIGQ